MELRAQTAGFPQRTETFALMTNVELKGRWHELTGKLKQKYAQLTDDDLMFVEGKEDELYGRLQTRLGKTKDDLRQEFSEM